LASATDVASRNGTNGNGAQPSIPEGVPASALRQFSIPSVPRNADGTTLPDDYITEMADPARRTALFEEMGQSDDAVRTGIDARRQEMNAANWNLSDEGSKDSERLDFTEDNIYPLIDEILRTVGGGGIQFGFGCGEPVYQWADKPPAGYVTRGKTSRRAKTQGRRIYLGKFAHIRQPSVETFQISETGELENIIQYPNNGVITRRVVIPGDKPVLWVYDKQGDDYWGNPPTRHCYKAWKFKQQIQSLNLLHLDKFGVGTVAIQAGEGWTELEIKDAAKFARNWRSSSDNHIIYPFGGTIELLADEGKTTMSMLEWVRYYNLQIAKTFLTHQTELGSTETGARALGDTFFEQMTGIVQADCENLAALINNKLIVPLILWNFGPQDSYPVFTPTERVHRAGGGVAAVLQQLITAGAIHPRPEDEVYLRDVFGLPPVELKTLEAEQTERDTVAKAAQDAASAANQSPVGGPPGGARNPVRSGDSTPAKPSLRALSLTLADGAPTPAVRSRTSWRTVEFSDWEQRVVRPDLVMWDLDLQSARLAGEVKDVLREIDSDLALQAELYAGEGAEALKDGIRNIRVPGQLRSKLRRVLLEAAKRARDYGTQTVQNEVRRQAEPEGIGPQRSPSIAPAALSRRVSLIAAGEEDNRMRDTILEAEVQRAAEEEADRREQSTRTAVLTALTQAAGAAASALASIAATAVIGALESLSTGRTESNVQGVVNVGFGIGRGDGADAINAAAAGNGGAGGIVEPDGTLTELVSKVYSAVMDLGTCDECAKWDGAQFPIDYPEDYRGVQAPNPRCAGGYSRCRCVFIYVTDAESVPLVPASKGPRGMD
jgi:uncharacterized protein DUF935